MRYPGIVICDNFKGMRDVQFKSFHDEAHKPHNNYLFPKPCVNTGTFKSKWSANFKGDHIEISEDGLTATSGDFDETVRLADPLPRGEVTTWEFILGGDWGEAGSFVGVLCEGKLTESDFNGLICLNEPLYTCAYGLGDYIDEDEDEPALVYVGKDPDETKPEHWINPGFEAGDCVKVRCDLREGNNHLTFWKNAERIGPKDEEYTIMLPKDEETWFAAASFCGGDEMSCYKVRFES